VRRAYRSHAMLKQLPPTYVHQREARRLALSLPPISLAGADDDLVVVLTAGDLDRSLPLAVEIRAFCPKAEIASGARVVYDVQCCLGGTAQCRSHCVDHSPLISDDVQRLVLHRCVASGGGRPLLDQSFIAWSKPME